MLENQTWVTTIRYLPHMIVDMIDVFYNFIVYDLDIRTAFVEEVCVDFDRYLPYLSVHDLARFIDIIPPSFDLDMYLFSKSTHVNKSIRQYNYIKMRTTQYVSLNGNGIYNHITDKRVVIICYPGLAHFVFINEIFHIYEEFLPRDVFLKVKDCITSYIGKYDNTKDFPYKLFDYLRNTLNLNI